MKVVSIALRLVFVAGLIQRAAGLSCTTGNCAACWKIDSPGIDIKMPCPRGDCGKTCPSGYDRIHCAKTERCEYEVDPLDDMFYFLTKRFLLVVQEAIVVENLARVYVESTMMGKSANRWTPAGVLIDA